PCPHVGHRRVFAAKPSTCRPVHHGSSARHRVSETLHDLGARPRRLRRSDDENDDDLVYSVLYRREGETEWTPLRRGVDEPILVWDTTLVPNGTYFVRIVAS